MESELQSLLDEAAGLMGDELTKRSQADAGASACLTPDAVP